jgi:hypothetical protein
VGWLTEEDLARFGRDGYLVLRDAVPEALLAAADAEVDDLVATVDAPPAERPDGTGCRPWFGTVAGLPRCADLLHRSRAVEVARELVAPQPIDIAFDTVQVATTIPPWPHIPGAPHIDGHHDPTAERPGSFTMLAGVALTDQRSPQSGNLWVWPGSHLGHQALFRERGTRVLGPVAGHAVWLDPPLDQGPGTELLMGRGDVVLSHFLLGHNKGGNTSPVVRRTIYFRMQVPGHVDRWEATFLDPWTEYAPVRAALGSAGVPR